MAGAAISASTEHLEAPGFRLRPGERLHHVEQHPDRGGDARPSAIRQLLRLSGSGSVADIGESGPCRAALPLTDDAPPELRLYEAVFGRDSLRVAADLRQWYPQLAHATLRTLASAQGITDAADREEEPGRIAHEIRDPADPIAQKLTAQSGWGWPYYGSVDATASFVQLMAAHAREQPGFLAERVVDAGGSEVTMATVHRRAVGWLLARMDASAIGMVEYQTPLPAGLENQAWRDSQDAYHHSDGTLANHSRTIAALSVNVATYDALLDTADLVAAGQLQPVDGWQLEERAGELRRGILDRFWTDERGGYFVLGLDRDDADQPRQLRIRTSEMGCVLDSRLLTASGARGAREGAAEEIAVKRDAVVSQLMSPDLLAAGGLRTLAADEHRYRPGAYHCGSVWPWETRQIAVGLRRHGFTAEADDLDRRVLSVVAATGRFPEYVRGDPDEIRLNTRTVDVFDAALSRPNRIEQPPQEVQAWTVSAALAIKLSGADLDRPPPSIPKLATEASRKASDGIAPLGPLRSGEPRRSGSAQPQNPAKQPRRRVGRSDRGPAPGE